MKIAHFQQSRVLVNSLPKSGTYLLTRAIEIFGYKEYATHRGYIKRMLDSLGFSTPKYFNYRQAKDSVKKGKSTYDKIAIGTFTPYFVNQSTIKYWLNAVPHSQYIQGHIPFTPTLTPIITKLFSFGYNT